MSKRHKTSRSTPSGSTPRKQRKARKHNLNWLWIALGVATLAATVFLLFRWTRAIPTDISVAQAYEKHQQGAFFLDVRSQEEWNQVHIAKSTLIPLGELQGRSSELPRDQDIVVVCASGVRSKEGVTILRQAGFSRASCMSGGLQAWEAAGYPLERATPGAP
jgi:rhodanese-related sulfurtransferase